VVISPNKKACMWPLSEVGFENSLVCNSLIMWTSTKRNQTLAVAYRHKVV